MAYDAVEPKALAAKFGVTAGDSDIVSVPIWTTTPWTLPASLAVTVGAELDYVLVEGPARGGRRVLLVLAQALVEKALKRYGIDAANILGHAKGEALELLKLKHPFYHREVPLILGDHVSAEDGTGAVHTAPAHGVEDFAVGQKYGLEVFNPVGGNGVYLPDTEIFGGQYIWKANDAIVDLLRERGVLLASEKITHSYPHCWRHRTPVIFRATPQWFISMDEKHLRRDALKAIHDDVKWYPAWGEERIAGMIEGRPDWCISRQRTWGVPIPLFAHKSTSEPHPRSVELMEQVAQRVEKEGADAWYRLDARELIGSDAENYVKVTDILDVWFDSGVTHYCVLDQRPNLKRGPGDKVIYLEGSDQHRGWFHSSLLTSVAMHEKAPYDEVLTHGFTVDAQGRKMSKSLGNGIEPQDVMKTYGADILRLWIASADYRNEMALSDEILKRVADSYRRIRNTARFLLGNLHGFDPAQHLLPVKDSLLLDQWAVQQAYDTQQAVVAAYAALRLPGDRAAYPEFLHERNGRAVSRHHQGPLVHDAGGQPRPAQRAERDVPHPRSAGALARAGPVVHGRGDLAADPRSARRVRDVRDVVWGAGGAARVGGAAHFLGRHQAHSPRCFRSVGNHATGQENRRFSRRGSQFASSERPVGSVQPIRR